MSSGVTKCLLNADALNCESHKKLKRKRHRNRSRYSNIKKKRQKKFHFKNKPDIPKPDISKFDLTFDSSKVMSNWYWSNYRKALEWQEKHRAAHWKSCALALLEENRYLLQVINQLHPGMHSKASVTENYLSTGFPSCQKPMSLGNYQANIFQSVTDYDNDENDEEDDDEDRNEEDEMDDVEFEMSEEMVKFFEQSYKHKMELKELKERESRYNPDNEIKELQANKIKRSAEMKLLYGGGASMITGMETAMQLSFEKYCDTKSPKYWPNIPFRL